MQKINLIEVVQPIGTFYIGKMNSTTLNKVSNISRRHENDGVQRHLNKKRVKEIAKYCEDPDATFPTPIILAVETTQNETEVDGVHLELKEGFVEFIFDDTKQFAEVLDGQHRLSGIKSSEGFECEMMVAIVFDVTEEEKAYIFSTINSNQAKVYKSIIYDLFELSEYRSPYKTCHDLARILNSTKDSPFYRKLKMLGKKTESTEILSQGTFVEYIVKLISKKPKDDMVDIKNKKELIDDSGLVLRSFFIEDKDDVISKLMLNYFGAVKSVFPSDWEECLVKTTGFGALVKFFPTLFKIGLENADLTFDFFEKKFNKIKINLAVDECGLCKIISDLNAGEQAQKKLVEIFEEANNK